MSPYPLNNILFLDIETVPQFADYRELPEEWKELWTRKSAFLIKDKEIDTPASVYNSAGIYAEFGKIICVTCGIISRNHDEKKLLLKSFYGDDEKILLQGFCDMVSKWGTGPDKFLCAHNGKEFDFPYLCRRLIIHGLCVPAILDFSGKKKWQVPHLDTMELWKFGDYKSYTSLNLLAHTLNIPTPKDDIDGSMVYRVYWEEHDLPRIVHYCQKDVFTVAQVYLRLHGETLIPPNNIDIK
ncbi:MAG: 3'-5' exonuclease [Bacteroidetes bacterium]|nr:3'-5' exonuclease [Bacteroidota bacterium]